MHSVQFNHPRMLFTGNASFVLATRWWFMEFESRRWMDWDETRRRVGPADNEMEMNRTLAVDLMVI